MAFQLYIIFQKFLDVLPVYTTPIPTVDTSQTT